MRKIDRIKEILLRHKRELQEQFKISEMGVFGSYVKNKQRNGSDVDILVEFKESPSLFEFMDLEEYFTKLLKIKVDLVTKKALRPYIGKYILREVVYI